MATPRADSYVAASGATVRGGVTSAAVRATPDATGGTVSQLLANWSGTGFQLLTTAPALYNSSAHASAVMDEAAGIVWIVGAETHNSTTGMDNSVYRFDIADGLFKRQYTKDTWPGEYRVGSDGILYANAAKTRPWAMHTFRRTRFIPATEEIEVIYNPDEHAYWNTAIQEGATTQANNVSAFWYYNVRTGTWRNDASGSRSTFAKQEYANGTVYVPGYGWYTIGDTWMRRLDESGAYTSTNLAGLINGNYHNALYLRSGELVKVGGHLATTGNLYSRTPLDNPTASTKYPLADYAALSGHSMENTATVQMPDGRILLFPTRTADNLCRPMVLDVGANTVTATGDSIAVTSTNSLSFRVVWSETHNCAIWVTGRVAGIVRAYAYRMP